MSLAKPAINWSHVAGKRQLPPACSNLCFLILTLNRYSLI